MSSRRFDTSDPFDQYLGWLFKSWIRQSAAPADIRRKLLQAAAREPVGEFLHSASPRFATILPLPTSALSRLMAYLFPDPAENAARAAHLFRRNAFLPQHRGSLAFLNLV